MSEDTKANEEAKILNEIGDYKYGFHDRDDNYVFKSERGLNRQVVENISRMKGEPQWMLDFRLKALKHYLTRPMPNWGPELNNLDLDNIFYYVKPTEKSEKSWDDVPDDIKNTFNKLGIPEAEQKFLAGVGAQYECLSGDTRVYTTRGVVPIRDVIPGDVVFSFNEETNEIIPAPVKNFMPKGERPIYEVKVGARAIRATENHPFLVLELHKKEGNQRGRYSRSWKYLSDIKEGDLVAVAKSLPDVGQDYVLEQPNVELNWRHNHVDLPKQTSNIHRFESKHPHDESRMMTGYRMMFSGDFDKLGCRSEQRLERMGKRKFHHSYSMAEGTSFRDHVNEYMGYVRVDSIQPAGVEQVFDIEIDGPHNFVAEGLIVHNSEMVYHSILEHLEKQGVIFLSIEDGLKQYPDLFKEYFGTVVPMEDNKFAALNSAVWSGGSFVYIPKGVKVDLPLQAYFRLNTANVGQFERTLIIVDEGASVHYVEGCFLAGAQVRTRNGEKPIEEVEVGDDVMTHQGRYRRVYNTMKRPYHGNIYNIRFHGDSARELNVTAEHPLLVVSREKQNERSKEFRPIWQFTENVKVGDYLVIPIPQPEAEFELMPTIKLNSRNLPLRRICVEDFLVTNIPDWFTENPAGDLSGSPFSIDENFLYVPIKEITVEEMETEVFNFSVEEDESYVAEGVVSHNCTAPQYTTNSFHSGVIEIIVKKGARSRYSTIQNWSTNVFNLVTQRAKVFENGTHEWVDANLGSKLTMKYPSCYLMEPGARGEMLSMAFAGPGQIQDAGSKMVHFAPNTTSKITSKSISKGGGRASYRGLVKVYKGSKGVKSNVVCDALLLDPKSRSDTYPSIEIDEDDVAIGHEASVSKVGEEQLFYLMSRGLTEEEATGMVVSGFIEPLIKELPMEYAVEMNRLIQLQMEGSIG